MRNLVKFMFMLQFIILSSQSKENFDKTETSVMLPNIWENEVVSRMIRSVIFRDLIEENVHKQSKRQHKREIYSTASPVAITKAETTRKSTLVATQKTRKPTKVTQSAGSKTKNRITPVPLTTSTRAPVKPNTKPLVTSLDGTELTGGLNSSKIKVRRIMKKMTC